jgi:hypothetical protein
MEKTATSWGFIEKEGLYWSNCLAASWGAGDGWIGRWQDVDYHWHIGRMWITFDTTITEEEWLLPYASAQAYITLPAIDWKWQAEWYYSLSVTGYSDQAPSSGKAVDSTTITSCLDGSGYSGVDISLHNHSFFSNFNTEGFTSIFIADDNETTYPYYPNQAKATKIDSSVTPTILVEFGTPSVFTQFFRMIIPGGLGTVNVGRHTVSASKTRNKYGSIS